MIGGLNKIGGIMNYINILGFYGFSSSGWFLTLIMQFLFALDRGIYFILEKVYVAFNYLCNLNLSNLSDLFGPLINRVYSLVGVILLFTLALKILQAIVDPDKSIVKNSRQFGAELFTTLALLMLTIPISGNRGIIFNYLDEIEDILLPSSDDSDTGVIMRFLFGEGSISIVGSNSDTFGRQMAKTILMQFIILDDGAGNDTEEKYNRIKYCANDSCDYDGLSDILGKKEIAYFPFMSGLVGIYMAYMLIRYSLWAVRRCFELAVLECLAPVFVLMRLGDKTKSAWNSFLGRFKDVYLKLFILMFSFYFSIMLINNVLAYAAKNVFSDSSVSLETTGSASSSLLAMKVNAANDLVSNAPSGFAGTIYTILLMVGILTFALALPDIIIGLLGIKSDENAPSLGAFVGEKLLGGASLIGTGLTAGAAWAADKATGGRFGDFVVDKGRKIRDAFDKNKGASAVITNRYNQRHPSNLQNSPVVQIKKPEPEVLDAGETEQVAGYLPSGNSGNASVTVNVENIGAIPEATPEEKPDEMPQNRSAGSYSDASSGGGAAIQSRQSTIVPERKSSIYSELNDALANEGRSSDDFYEERHNSVNVAEINKNINIARETAGKRDLESVNRDIGQKRTIDDSPNLMADFQSQQEVRNIYNNKENI